MATLALCLRVAASNASASSSQATCHIRPPRQGRWQVLMVHRAVDDKVRELRLGRDLISGFETLVGRESESFGSELSPRRVGIRDGNNLHPIRCRVSVVPVCHAPMARSDDDALVR